MAKSKVVQNETTNSESKNVDETNLENENNNGVDESKEESIPVVQKKDPVYGTFRFKNKFN